MSSPGRRPPLQREAIVGVAHRLVSEQGLDALTLRRLAAALSVSAPALYAHFTDKHDLLRSVAELEFDELISRYERIEREIPPGDPVARVRAQFRAYVHRAREDPELFKVMFLFPPDLGEIVAIPEGAELPAATRAFNMAVATVAEALAAGAIHADDPLMVALAMWSGAHGVATVLSLGLELSAEFEDLWIDEVCERLLRGYGHQS